jgi:hypothetical protein
MPEWTRSSKNEEKKRNIEFGGCSEMKRTPLAKWPAISLEWRGHILAVEHDGWRIIHSRRGLTCHEHLHSTNKYREWAMDTIIERIKRSWFTHTCDVLMSSFRRTVSALNKTLQIRSFYEWAWEGHRQQRQPSSVEVNLVWPELSSCPS